MTDRFQNTYRIASARLPQWDYRRDAAYFVTICTQGRIGYFGEVIDGKVQLSPVGVIADVLWNEIKNHTQHIQLGAYVVMPNHLHGILILRHSDENAGMTCKKTMDTANDGGTNVETLHATSLQREPEPQSKPTPIEPNQTYLFKSTISPDDATSLQPKSTEECHQDMSAISPKPGALSTIIRSYKSAVTRHVNRLGLKNGWQSRYYDHIIRDADEYKRIEHYILTNPQNWDTDKLNP